MGKIVDKKRMIYERKERPIKMNSLAEEILWCVQQGLRSFNLLTSPWIILIELIGPRRIKVVGWFPENITLPKGYHYPKGEFAFFHEEDHSIDSFMDVNFWPISREIAKKITQKYKGE